MELGKTSFWYSYGIPILIGIVAVILADFIDVPKLFFLGDDVAPPLFRLILYVSAFLGFRFLVLGKRNLSRVFSFLFGLTGAFVAASIEVSVVAGIPREIVKIGVELVVFMFLYLISEVAIPLQRFIKVGSIMRIRANLSRFIRKFDDAKSEDKASLALFLARWGNASTQQSVTSVHTTLENYILLLAAAVYTTQKEWFATYLLRISDWEKVVRSSGVYDRALSSSAILKKRYVVIDSANESEKALIRDKRTYLIQTTLKAGSAIYFVDTDTLRSATNNKDFSVPDFAMFDDDLVITASFPAGQEYKPDTKVEVKIVNGRELEPYRHFRDVLKQVQPLKAYPPSPSFELLENLIVVESEEENEGVDAYRNLLDLVSNMKGLEAHGGYLQKSIPRNVVNRSAEMVRDLYHNNRIEVPFTLPLNLYTTIMDSGIDQVYATSLVNAKGFWRENFGEDYWTKNMELLKRGGKVERIFVFETLDDFESALDVMARQLSFKYKDLEGSEILKIAITSSKKLSPAYTLDFALYEKDGISVCALELRLSPDGHRIPTSLTAYFKPEDQTKYRYALTHIRSQSTYISISDVDNLSQELHTAGRSLFQ